MFQFVNFFYRGTKKQHMKKGATMSRFSVCNGLVVVVVVLVVVVVVVVMVVVVETLFNVGGTQ